MSKIEVTVTEDVSLAVDKITEEIDTIIGEEVHNFYRDLKRAGRKVWDTGHFFKMIQVPRKKGNDWVIQLKAKYSSILWRGRRTIGGKNYGSDKWTNGGALMLAKLESTILRRVKNVNA